MKCSMLWALCTPKPDLTEITMSMSGKGTFRLSIDHNMPNAVAAKLMAHLTTACPLCTTGTTFSQLIPALKL